MVKWYCDQCLDRKEVEETHEWLLHQMLMVDRQRSHPVMQMLQEDVVGFLIASFLTSWILVRR